MSAKELKKEIITVLVLNSAIRTILKTAIIFLFLLLVHNTLGLSIIIAIAIPVIYFTAEIHHQLRKNRVAELEEKIPSLRDRLSATIDNFDADTEIAEELKKGVLKDLRNIKISGFIEQKKIIYDFSFIAILALLIIITAPYKIENSLFDFNIGKENQKENKAGIYQNQQNEKEGEEQSRGDFAGRNKFSTILGNKTIIKTGDENANINIESKESSSETNQGRNLEGKNEKKNLQNTQQATPELYLSEESEENKRIIEKFYQKLE